MKNRILIGILALLLWLGPLAVVYHFATIDAQGKSYDLIALDRAEADSLEGISDSLDSYLVYAGAATLIIILIYGVYVRKTRGREEEKNERRASEYMKDLL